jgi:hypothetical protein
MTSTTEDTRYSRAAIASVITQALVNCDLAHEAQWIRPGTCPCRRVPEQHGAGSCLLPPDGGCRGHAVDAALPPGKALTADELIASLPEPDSRGLISAIEAGSILGRMASTRLSWSPYRKASLFARLGDALQVFEESLSPGKGTGQQDAGQQSGMPRCGYCGQPYAAKRSTSKWCSPACRTAHWKAARKAKR